MRKPTSAATIRRLSDATTAEGLKFVRARTITEALWKTGEEYHAGAIDHAEYGRRNRALWDEAEREGVTADVKRRLRDR